MTDLEHHVWDALALIEREIRRRGGVLQFTMADSGILIHYTDGNGVTERMESGDCLAAAVIRVHRRWSMQAQPKEKL